MQLIESVLNFLLISTVLDNDSNISNRIIGGTEISIEKCPYQLSLMKTSKHICGAVVINKNWALTTANCVKGLATKDLSVRAGSTFHNIGGTIHEISKVISHSSYNAVNKDYDIALIQVIKVFDMKKVKAIPLASEGSLIQPGSKVLAFGWGVYTPGGSQFADALHQINVPIVDKNICNIANNNLISDRMLCAGFTSGGQDICDGDFGGPMVYQEKLIGLASWSKSCGQPGGFGVYTSISKLRSWIKKTSGI